jgi:hypothetical protein
MRMSSVNLYTFVRPNQEQRFKKQIYRVHTGPGKPGKSWNFNIPKSRPGKSWKIESLDNINKVFYLFQFTSHNNNMNCYYITDFCKSGMNFVLLLYLLLLKY